MDFAHLRAALTAAGLDAAVAVSPENFYYTTGSYLVTQRSLRERLAMAVFPGAGEPAVIVCGIEESFTRQTSRHPDIRTYVEFAENPVEVLGEVLREKGVSRGRVGIETHYLSWHYALALQRACPDAEFVDCSELFFGLRARKLPHEVERLEFAARSTLAAMQAGMQSLRPGDRERDLAARLKHQLIDSGADEVGFLVLGTGPRSSIAHPIPGETPFRSGDAIKIDMGGLYGGYYSDVARTFGFGRPDPRKKDRYRRLAEIHRSVIDLVRVGARFCDLFEFCKGQFARHGLSFHMPHIGHGLGVELHERPVVEPTNTGLVEEGMVINIEPIFFDPEDGSGYHIEDLVLVTAQGPRVLTGSALDVDMGWYGD
ncbi:MAG: Xaa-Pro peptidase family protein [Firmicutes bacterium]|jgi:Xaa-Pro aminopeptidase|nr:Xaa-Pro peptidase family protein [Bacillota bacterium]